MSDTADVLYATTAKTLLRYPDVAPHRPPKSGVSTSLCVNSKIFVMLVKGRLVVKLPQERVDALVESGIGVRHDLGEGRVMKEWLVLAPDAEAHWLPIALEALEYVRSKQ